MSQRPAEWHVTINKGEDWSKVFRVYDRDANTGAKTQRSLTGYTASFTAEDIDGGTVALNLGVTAGTTLTVTSGTSDDYVSATVNETVSAALTAGTYKLLFALTVGGTTLYFASGTVTVAAP